MKNSYYKLSLIFLILLALPNFASAQDDLDFELSYEVNRVYPYISITEEKLNEAERLTDINPLYKPSWVREYISVEVVTNYKGETQKAIAKNDVLSQKQKEIMNAANPLANITVTVKYMPENTLKNNTPKEFDFSFIVEPAKDASYPGGEQKLKQYLKENAMDKISPSSFKKYNLTAVNFAINEKGKIVDAQVFQSSKDEKIDQLLLETVNNMPNWAPAEYANGTKVKQKFVLAVGDRNSCNINLLSIRKN